ncbi:MAG: aminotransferase class V-fold PLP-dependent enzyme [Cyclobacteriaceae bacterium]|nr:aminotransferase class V-fold PLP-dependent enzyme [Cyclobacteriaceae bacterium]
MSRKNNRTSPLEMSPEEFRQQGYKMIDTLADYLENISNYPVTPGESPQQVRKLLQEIPFPEEGESVDDILSQSSELLIKHSLFNGHPRFWGFITSSAAPAGALADLLASSINPNVGGWWISPMATEIELQTIDWIARLLGFPTPCGGIMVSGGNMANIVPFYAARRKAGGEQLRSQGVATQKLVAYASRETHTWIEKAADLSGLGTDSIRWIDVDDSLRMDIHKLKEKLKEDKANGYTPFLIVGTGGSVSTGAIDPLHELRRICDEENIWFHVDGAYGAPAAILPTGNEDLKGLKYADSVAVDPHKWLYAPIEAGCVLVKDPKLLSDAFSFHPPYYPDADHSEEAPVMFFERGPQNTRGFRALKVWTGIRQAGRAGYIRMIGDDINLAKQLFESAKMHHDLEAFTQGLSITTFRYNPVDKNFNEEQLNRLNKALVDQLQQEGKVFLTHAVIKGTFVLRACIVNFRTNDEDITFLIEETLRVGRIMSDKVQE